MATRKGAAAGVQPDVSLTKAQTVHHESETQGSKKQFSKKEATERLEELKGWMRGRVPDAGEERELTLRVNAADGTLGPWARWFAVLWVIKDQCPGQSLSKWLNATPDDARDRKSDDSSLVSVFRGRVGPNVYEAGTGMVFRRLLARLNADRESRQLPKLSPEMLLTAKSPKVTEEACFERFCHWVAEGTRAIPAGVHGVLDAAQAVGKEHAGLVKQVEELLAGLSGRHQSDDGATDQTGAYISLYGQVDTNTRRGIAAEIARKVHAKAKLAGSNLGVMYVDASATSMTRSVTPADALEVMCKELDIATLGSLHESGEAYDHAIDAVRKATWRQEVLVILDGLVHVSGVQAGLVKVMADRDWDGFMRTLSQPDVAGLNKRARKPRWFWGLIAISDGPLQQSAEWTSLSLPIETPDAGTGEAFAASDVTDPEAIAMLMVAASVDGLRQATLQRCLQRWGDAVRSESSWAILRPLADALQGMNLTELCDRLVARSGGRLLDTTAKATVPGLEPRQRRYELQLDPHSTEEADEPVPDGRAKPPTKRLLSFRTEQERRAFLVSHFKLGDRGETGRAQRDLNWWTLNWVLAEEALAQATGALRKTSTSVGFRARGCRRLLQALHHALHSGPVEPRDLNNNALRPPERRLMASMPTARWDRLRYCFAFIYSSVIEGDEWLLTRSLARSDVRVGLLALFIAKDPRDLIVADADGDLGAFVDSIREGWQSATERCSQPHRELLEEVMLSLATAAVDSENDEIANCCISELRALGPRMEARVNALRSEWPEVSITTLEPGWDRRTSALSLDLKKLELDLLDSNDNVAEAIAACNAEIKRLASPSLDTRIIWKVASNHGRALYRGKLNLAGLTNELDAFVAAALGGLRNKPRRWVVVGALVDLLARLADYVATLSDKGAEQSRETDSVPYRRAVHGFVTSWAFAYVADGLRAAAAVGRSDGQRWQSISARPYRVYVRVSLKLSRLTSDAAMRLLDVHAEGPNRDIPAQAELQLDVAKAFLAHGQERANVYARTLHRYVRERFQSILLQATIVRCWASHSGAQRRLHAETRKVDPRRASLPSWTIFEDALDYVYQAEKVLLELEAPDLLGRRLLLERVSILICMLQLQDDADGPDDRKEKYRLTLLIETYMGALVRVTRSRKFWTRLADRQVERWNEWKKKQAAWESQRRSKKAMGQGVLG